MFPLHIADVTAAIRVSGRRICIRRSSRPRSLHLQIRAATLSSNCDLSSWYSTRHSPSIKDSRWSPIDRLFIGALVKASLCRVHSASFSVSTQPPSTGLTKRPLRIFRYGYLSTFRRDLEKIWYREKVPEKFRPSLRALCGMTEGDPDVPHVKKKPPSPPLTAEGGPDPPKPPLSRQEREKYVMPMLFPSSHSELLNIQAFRQAIRQAHASPNSITNEMLFELYRKLPGYRVPYLDMKTMERFVGRLMTVPLRNQVSMLRYLTLIEDMKSAGVPIMRNEWNQAAAFVARSFKYTTAAELRAALELWQESERDYGVRADITTFNILLDGASKSKSGSLATTILKEIRARNLEYDRYTYTTLMMYHAGFGDATKIRHTYQDLVDAGEVVDTVVLNALMTALLMANEERSAANIYAYMKRVAVVTTKRPSYMMAQWRRKRYIAQRLKRRGLQWGKNYVEELNVQLGPDIASFHLWIHLYCRAGDWERVQFHIRDMEMFGCPINRDVYLSMLKGFAWHGTSLDTPWNRERLRLVLDKVLDERNRLVGEWDRIMAVWVVRAVEKVYHDEQVLAGVWDEIAAQWARQGDVISDFALGVYLSSMRTIAQDNEQRRMQQQPPQLPTSPETTDYLNAL